MTSRTRIAIAAAIATALGTLALLPAFSDFSWTVPTIGAVFIVFGAAELARLIGVPSPLATVWSVAVLAAYVTAVFSGGTAVAVVGPGHDARAHLHTLVHQGLHDISRLQAPVPSNRGLVLLTTIGVGLVAVVVDIIACSMRRPAVAGLPLLALYAVSAATVKHGVGALPFLYGAAGFLVLLLTDSHERVNRWGRPLGSGYRHPQAGLLTVPERADTSALTHVGRRVGIAAVGVAVVLPALVPGLHPGLFGAHGGAGHGSGHGPSTVTTYNPITRIRRQLVQQRAQPLFTYRTNASSPGYLRMTVLDIFNGNSWSQSDLSAPSSQEVSKGLLPSPLGLTDPSIITTTVQTDAVAESTFSVPWLPVPYSPTRVDVDGDWRYDAPSRAIFSTEKTTQALQWSVSSTEVDPTASQVAQASGVTNDPAITEDAHLDSRIVPSVLIRDAARITRHAHTPYAKAVALQDWFHDPSRFHYSLNVSDANDRNAIANFLHDGTGYCVQFASTMALMARSLGIPTRLAIGFTPGSKTSDGSYVVTTKDAHVWPELYFVGIGWLAFEPTPRADGQATTPSYTTKSHPTSPSTGRSGGQNTQPTPHPTATPSTKNPAQDKLNRLSGATAAAGGHRKSGGGGGTAGQVVGLLALVVLVLAAPATSRRLTRRRRWARAETPAARAAAAWREVGDDAVDLGFGWSVDDSPRRGATRLIAASDLEGEGRAALLRVARTEEVARYARVDPLAANTPAVSGLDSDVRTVRRALAARVDGRRRFVAAVAPPSTMRAATRAAAARTADALDALDAFLDAVPRQLRRLFSRLTPARGSST